jgi:hypothetical protein
LAGAEFPGLDQKEKEKTMSNNGWNKLVGVAGRLLMANLLVFSQSLWAMQDQQAKGKKASAEKPAAQQSAESTAAREKPSGGSHEGITVHGHWTIEVRNPDGSLARRVEFENSLDPGFTTANPTAGQPPLVIPGGAAYLSALLTGQWAAPVSPTSWQIALVGPGGLPNLTTSDPNAPCNVGQVAACVIGPPGCGAPTPGLSCNLSVAALGATPHFTGIRLSGSVAAVQNGQVVTVATFIIPLTCVVASTPSCLPSGVSSASFTSSTNFPGAPISVIAGQTIGVTVNISFS